MISRVGFELMRVICRCVRQGGIVAACDGVSLLSIPPEITSIYETHQVRAKTTLDAEYLPQFPQISTKIIDFARTYRARDIGIGTNFFEAS